MSTKCAPLQILPELDNFGHDHFFIMESRKKFKTCIGAILTVLSAAVFFLYIYRKMLVLLNDQNPDIIFNKVFSSSFFRIDLDEKDYVISFSVKLNGTLIKPAQVPKYIVPRGYKQMSYFMTDSESNLVANSSLFNLSVVPCLLHRKYARLQVMAQASPLLKNMLLSHSLCFDRNISLANDKNASNLMTVGGGLQNMPVELVQYLFINCSTALSPSCVGVKSSDVVEIQINNPVLSFALENSARPVSFTLDTFRPIVLNPAITKNYVFFLSMVSVYDQSDPFSQNKMVASLPQIEFLHTYPGKIPGVFATLMLRGNRMMTQVTRKYYTFLSLNSDFGSMLETITILAILAFYFNAKRGYTTAMKKVADRFTHQEVPKIDEIERNFEISSIIKTSRVQERLIIRSLLTSCHRSVLGLARVLTAKQQLHEVSDPNSVVVSPLASMTLKSMPYFPYSKLRIVKKEKVFAKTDLKTNPKGA